MDAPTVHRVLETFRGAARGGAAAADVRALAATAAPSGGKHGKWSNGAHGPVIKAQVKDVIKVRGRYFKDLNGNGRLDRYEDWRQSPYGAPTTCCRG